MVRTRRNNYDSPSITITKRSKRNVKSLRRKNEVMKAINSVSTESVNMEDYRKKYKEVFKIYNKKFNCDETLKYVYRTVNIENMNDFKKLDKYENMYRYAFYIIVNETDTSYKRHALTDVCVGRTETSCLRRKFCNVLCAMNDVLIDTHAKLYLVLSNRDTFIRNLNNSVFKKVKCVDCSLSPIMWRYGIKNLKHLIESRDAIVRNSEKLEF